MNESFRRVARASRSRAFSLIELLVVIAIIGLLASIILASLNTARQKGRDARRVSDIKEIQLALELYYDSYNAYPSTIAGAVLAPTYISVLPTDPSNSHNYAYVALQGSAPSGTCGSYHLGASLEVYDSSTLTGDADATPSTDGSLCAGGTDFSGTNTNTVVQCQSTDAGSYCYDVKP